MYQLDAYGAPIQLCSTYNNNLTRYGCTAYDGYYPYPYASNPASVNIQFDYLLDVVAKEMGPSNHLAAMYAQAIASRSYAHWHIENSAASINNSAGFQVFVPYAFDILSSADQQRVQSAVLPNYYLSWSYSQLPAKTMFGADAWARTVTGDKPYLTGIEDPISSSCDASNGPPGQPYHRIGLSQRGANRWLNGSQCYSRHQRWSVQWPRVEQILFHYYSDVHMRYLDSQQVVTWLSPIYRWNPLQINWGSAGDPPVMIRGNTYNISVFVQNTSAASWTCGASYSGYYLRYTWYKPSAGSVVGTGWAQLCGLSPGASTWANLTINDVPNSLGSGPYLLRFDIEQDYTSGGYTYFSNMGWATYDVSVAVDGTQPATTLYQNGQSSGFPMWYTGPVTARLSATDQSAGHGDISSGVNRIVYRVAYSPWQTAYGSEVTLWLANDGWQQIDYYAVDNAGNVEPQRGQMTQIDQTAPSAPAAAAEAHGVTHNVWQNGVAAPTFTWDAGADLTSGVAQYQARVANQQTGAVIADATRAPNDRQLALAAQTTGAYRLSLRAQDVAGNWSAWADRFTFRFDNTPPAPPAGLIHTAGIVHNVWQSSVADAAFTWQFSDPGIGTGGYDLYWGADPNGTSAAFVSATHYTAGPPSAACASQRECVGYLRLRPRDTLNNLGAWQTHFILRYDAAPPALPASVVETHGAVSTVWQNTIAAPAFVWNAATDNGAGVSSYGVRVTGASGALITDTTRAAGNRQISLPALSTGAYTFSLRAGDSVGNWSNWAGLFVFRFDNTPPAIPAVSHAAGIASGVWQSTTRSADFTWTFSDPGIGAGGHYVYWGDQPDGAGATFVTDGRHTSGDPSAACAGQSACEGYLRLRGQDALGNVGTWATAFVLRYDAAPPVVADVSVITGGTGLGYAALPTGTTWISVTATDIGSGLSRMRVRVSNPGDQAGAWSLWIRYAGRFLWQLPGETEPVELCIQTQDAVGWESDEVCRIVTWSAPDVWQRFLPRMAR